MGDDVTDEDMFAELEERDASVAVGSRPPCADAYAPNVRTVRQLLAWIAATRRGAELALPSTLAIHDVAANRYRMLVMSNRTPAEGGGRAVGGLVSALEPALRDDHGVWLGWAGQGRGRGSRIVPDPQPGPGDPGATRRRGADDPDRVPGHTGHPQAP